MEANLTVGQKLTKYEIHKAIACREFDVRETIQTLKHFGGSGILRGRNVGYGFR